MILTKRDADASAMLAVEMNGRAIRRRLGAMPFRLFLMLFGFLTLGLFQPNASGGDDDDGDDGDDDDRRNRGRGRDRDDRGDDDDDSDDGDDGDDGEDDDGEDDDDPKTLKASIQRLERALRRQRNINRDLKKGGRGGGRTSDRDDRRSTTRDDDSDRDDRKRSGRRDAGDREIDVLKDRLDRYEEREREDRAEREAVKIAKSMGVSDDDADLVWYRIRRDIEWDDDGFADNIDDLLDDLREDKPHLFEGKNRGMRRAARSGAGRSRSTDRNDDDISPGVDRLREGYAEADRNRRRSSRRR